MVSRYLSRKLTYYVFGKYVDVKVTRNFKKSNISRLKKVAISRFGLQIGVSAKNGSNLAITWNVKYTIKYQS